MYKPSLYQLLFPRLLFLSSNPLFLSQTRHTLVYEGLWRSQTCLDLPATPKVISDDCGDIFKSSLRHVVNWDERAPHAPGFPPSGRQVSLISEFAGLGGDVGFFKNEIRAKSSALLLKNLVSLRFPAYKILLRSCKIKH